MGKRQTLASQQDNKASLAIVAYEEVNVASQEKVFTQQAFELDQLLAGVQTKHGHGEEVEPLPRVSGQVSLTSLRAVHDMLNPVRRLLCGDMKTRQRKGRVTAQQPAQRGRARVSGARTAMISMKAAFRYAALVG